MSQVSHDMKGMIMHSAVMEESYGIPPISTNRADKWMIRRLVRHANDSKLWSECFSCSIVHSCPYMRVRDCSHFTWTKMLTKAILA